MNFLDRLLKIDDKKELKRLNKIVDEIETLAIKFEEKNDDELIKMTSIFKERLKNGETLDSMLVEAFATIREASRRVLGMYHYRVQLIGGIVLHEGKIAQMRTGEGKTLVGTLPVYLNALTGKGVHVVTVNDYLAKRDKEEMSKLYEFLGLSVGVIISGQNHIERKEQYKCDIVYGTNNEYGFDYLKDNMVMNLEEKVQRSLNYAIVDEIDSILIDEARTPLIISGTGDNSTSRYIDANIFISILREDDYEIEEKQKTVSLTDIGIQKAELYFNVKTITDLDNIELYHHINQALKAHKTMKKDIDYICKDGEVVIVDEFTGRLMDGRRYSDGLHQAIEAKEDLKINKESKTLASITFQNYFRMYDKLSGMTGTGKTEEEEFKSIYRMNIVEIPTNKPTLRKDLSDVVYKTEQEKFEAVINDAVERHDKKQPVLVGTSSIEDSEKISQLLKRRKVPHRVLNAKQHDKEAEIIAQAGRLGAITIATNMAGRGTDISLGGNPIFLARKKMKELGYNEELVMKLQASMSFFIHDEELYNAKRTYESLLQKYRYETKVEQKQVFEAGGLAVIGTQRHESRRIDNQLRGRAGRQGDPGCSRFYVSLEDKLIKVFSGNRMKFIIEKIDIENGEPIDHKIISKSIENAQKKVEGSNFGVRKHVIEYDDIMNNQRKIIYEERNKVLENKDIKDEIENIIHDLIKKCIRTNQLDKSIDLKSVNKYIKDVFSLEDIFNIEGIETLKDTELINVLSENMMKIYNEKEKLVGAALLRQMERMLLLKNVDNYWMEHIDDMNHLRQGISLRAIGQQDPVLAYKNEGFDMFNNINQNIKEHTIKSLFKINPMF